MNRSDSVKELATALALAQAEMLNPTFDSVNPHFKNRFASLASVRSAVIPVLNKHGLSIAQFPVCTELHAGVVNVLLHTSGQLIEESCILPLTKNDAQGAGSAITYARRYSLQSIAGVVADEDDDANAASTKEKPAVGLPSQGADIPPASAPGRPPATRTDTLRGLCAKAQVNMIDLLARAGVSTAEEFSETDWEDAVAMLKRKAIKLGKVAKA